MVTLLLSTWLAHADEAPTLSVEPAYVVVDKHAWLYDAPDEDAPRWRVDDVDVAPEYRPSPVLLLLRTKRSGDFVGVRVVTMAPPLSPAGFPVAPDTTPAGWRHCYPQAPAIAQLGVTTWVREADLLSVTTREVTVTTAEGDRIVMGPGLVVQGKDGVHRVRSHHLTVLATLPEDAIGRSYPLDRPALSTHGLVAKRGDVATVVHPVWEATFDLRGDALSARYTPTPRAPEATALREPCIEVAPARPLPQVPTRREEELRAGKTHPILVPVGTPITTAEGDELGTVGGGDLVLWSRTTCANPTMHLTCCDPMPSVEATPGHPGLCFAAALQPPSSSQSLAELVTQRSEELATIAEIGTTLTPQVTWDPPVTTGSVTPEDITLSLRTELETLTYCYERSLNRDPTVRGSVSVRFAVGADGHGRPPRVEEDLLGDRYLIECVKRRLTAMMVPNQISQPATIVELTMRFATVPDR